MNSSEHCYNYESFGSTTWKRQDLLAGAEPDNCFYIQNEGLVRGRLDIDLTNNPPPDLVLEINITSKSLDRQPIDARLGVPEIWCYDQIVLQIYQLETGKYVETENSLAFASFPPVKLIPGFLDQNINAGRRAVRQAFRAWVRKHLAD